MTYISKTSREFEASALMPEGFGLLKALKAIAAILREAFALARACNDMLQRRRERHALLELDDRLLDDVGMTLEDAERQARKWLWQ